jgi:SAM-dependent methyltransferase
MKPDQDVAGLKDILACPDCRGVLSFAGVNGSDVRCSTCDYEALSGNLLPRRPATRTITLPVLHDPKEFLERAVIGSPLLTYTGPIPPRNAIDLFSLLTPAVPPAKPLALDLGCGAGDCQEAFHALGYRYVGVDVSGPGPTLLADAHSLPFKDASFDLVFSMAVLEHVHNPFLALSEVARVLKPGCRFIGVAAFGEPFHASYFHASSWGIVSLLSACGFVPERLWSCRDTLCALADMAAYPKAVRWLLRGVGFVSRFPLLSPRRWWSGGSSPVAALATAGSIGFAAHRPK